jgi:hypothetical protein
VQTTAFQLSVLERGGQPAGLAVCASQWGTVDGTLQNSSVE